MPKNNSLPANEDDKIRYTDQSTDKRIHEHLSNEKDIISEDDIRNVKTDETILIPNDDNESAEYLESNAEQKPATDDDHYKIKDNESDIESSWNILDSE